MPQQEPTIAPTPNDWVKYARVSNIQESDSIHDEKILHSGSKMSYKQFMLLRAIWPVPKSAEALGVLWKDGKLVHESDKSSAESFLNDHFPCWTAYLDALESKEAPPFHDSKSLKEGIFALVRKYNIRIASEVDEKSKPTEDTAFSPRKTRSQTALEQRKQQQQQEKLEDESPSTRTQSARSAAAAAAALPTPAAAPAADPSTPAADLAAASAAAPARLSTTLPLRGRREDNEANEANEDNEDSEEYAPTSPPHTPENKPERSDSDDPEWHPDSDSSEWSSSTSSNIMSRPAEDEQVVNFALLVLAQGLSIHYPLDMTDGADLKSRWTEHRRAFKVKTREGRKVYEARVDGYLKPVQSAPPQVIIEVKPGARRHHQDAIRKQESGQMAAWIAEHPPKEIEKENNEIKSYRRLLVAQDHNEVYLIIGEFNSEYVKYVQGKRRPDMSTFLHMQEYGPFEHNNVEHMKVLGNILLGITLAGGISDSIEEQQQ